MRIMPTRRVSGISLRHASSQKETTLPFRQVFVINLARRPERLASIMRQLTNAGISEGNGFHVERFEAIDGSRLDTKVLVRRGFLSRLGALRLAAPTEDKIWGMDLNAGGVGCAMSHITLWAKIACLPVLDDATTTSAPSSLAFPSLTAEKRGVLVVEDDAMFLTGNGESSFLTRLQERMRHVPADWNMVYIGGLDTAGAAPKLRVGEGVSLVPQMHRTTHCYVIRPEGARQLLQRCVPFTYQIDTQMTAEVSSTVERCKLVGDGARHPGPVVTVPPYAVAVDGYYTLQPPLVTQAGNDVFVSDIQSPSL